MNKKNGEGYQDPTAYEALTTIQKEEKSVRQFRPLVFICSPYAGDTKKNTSAAKKYSRFAVSQGAIPIAPHLLFTQFLRDDDRVERMLGLRFGEVLMSKCQEVWVFGSKISDGMRQEIARAKRKGYTLRYFTEECREVTSCR